MGRKLVQYSPLDYRHPLTLIIFGLFEGIYRYFFDAEMTTTLNYIVVGFVILSAVLGIFFTEPTGQLQNNHGDGGYTNDVYSPYDYHYTRAGGFYYYYYPMYFGGSSNTTTYTSSSSSSSNSKGMGYLLLAVLVIILIIGSAVIPHFWVVATFAGILFFLRITLQVLSESEYSSSWHYR